MLEQEGIYNDLSPKLREKLEARVNSFGKLVRYKFNLARPNPDPQKYNGDIIFPSQYNLHPVQWKITDTEEDRKDKQKVKNIGVIEKTERDERGNLQYRYTGVRVTDIERGIKIFDMTKEDDKTIVASMELHPKNGSGLFKDAQMVSMFSRIDNNKYAEDQRKERSARKKALDAVENMNDKEIVDFIDGMTWDSTDEPGILRNKVEEYAESNPDLFNDLVASDKIKYRSTIKKAIDNRILTHNISEGSISWTSTGLQIISLGIGNESKNDIERFSDWFLESGGKADVAYKKIKSLIEKPVQV